MKKTLYSVKRNSKNEMALAKNRDRHLIEFIITFFFLIAWCWGLLSIGADEGQEFTFSNLYENVLSKPFLWIFWIVAIGIIYNLIKSLRIVLMGESLIFDKNMNSFSINSRQKCKITDIAYVQIRNYTDSDGDTDYRLSLVLADQNKLFIDRSSNKNNIHEMGEEIADFVNVSVKVKK